MGYECYLIAPDDERTRDYCQEEGAILLPVAIHREISIFNDLKSLWAIIKHFYRIQPDIVNVGTPKMGLLGSLAGKMTGVKTRIYTCRGYRFEHEKGALRKILIAMEKLTSWAAHRVICISSSVQELGVQYAIFSGEKSKVINKGSSNGIELDQFSANQVPKAASASLRAALGINDTDFVYGFVGRLIDRKGIQELYDAFERISLVLPNIKLVVVGPVEKSQISDLTILEKLEEHSNILMVGKQADVPLYLSLMDVFVLPAWWEGFGNVLVQAAAMGVPVISTTGTGSRDAVNDNYNGILVPPKDTEALEKAMRNLYENESLRVQLGENGVAWSKHFKNTTIWEGMRELYEEQNV